MRETIQLYQLHRMREALGLSQEQTLDLMSVMEEREKAERELRERHREAREELRRLVEAGTAGDRECLSAVENFERVERDIRSKLEEFREKEDAILTPQQRAQRILFEPRFHEQMRRRMEQARRPQQGRRDAMRRQLEQLRETDPELYEAIRRRIDEGEPLTEEQKEQLLQLRRKKMQERRSRAGSGAP
jgi:Spy/CpxP family protein refolding chaperone